MTFLFFECLVLMLISSFPVVLSCLFIMIRFVNVQIINIDIAQTCLINILFIQCVASMLTSSSSLIGHVFT